MPPVLKANPAILIRFGGLSAEMLREQKRRPPLWPVAEEARIDALVKVLCDRLFEIIGASGGKIKIACIQLRRDLANRRWRRLPAQFAAIPADIQTPLAGSREELERTLHELEAARKSWLTAIAPYLETRLAALRHSFCASEAFRAMSLSAPTFWDRLLVPDEPLLGKAGLTPAGFSLLRYVSRASAKTSPFSYFGPIGFGQLTDDAHGSPTLELRSCTGLNVQAFVPAVIAWKLAHGLSPAGCPSRWNPSLCRMGDQYMWFAQSGASDQVRSLPAAADADLAKLLDAVIASFAGESCPHPNDRSPEEQRILEQLGILLPPVLRGETVAEELESARADVAITLKDDAMRSLQARYQGYLESSEAIIKTFAGGSMQQRADALAKATQLLKAITFDRPVDVSEHRGKEVAPTMLIREDVISAPAFPIARGDLLPCLGVLSKTQIAFRKHGQIYKCRQALGRLYAEWFGQSDSVPVVAFIGRLLKWTSAAGNESTSRLLDLRALLLQSTIEAAKTGRSDPISLPADFSQMCDYSDQLHVLDIGRLIEHLGQSTNQKEFVEVCAFLQRTGSGSEAGWVVNMMCPTGGRFLRRWLHHNSAFHREFLNWQEEAARDDQGRTLALPSAIYYNIDRGPSLIRRHVDIPGANYVMHGSEPEPIANLDVYLDADLLLSLRHRVSGQRIYTDYNSLINPDIRPISTQFLRFFDRGSGAFNFPMVSSLFRSFNRALPGKLAPVVHTPRIIAGAKVVLQRASWRVPKSLFPQMVNTPNIPTIIETYTRWAEEIGLPSCVYVRHNGNEERLAQSHDRRKPQFLDWRDPIWSLYFHKYARRTETGVTFTEALPDPTETSAFSMERVAELLVNWRFA